MFFFYLKKRKINWRSFKIFLYSPSNNWKLENNLDTTYKLGKAHVSKFKEAVIYYRRKVDDSKNKDDFYTIFFIIFS